MDSPRFETFDTLARLREFARSGDWKNADALAATLRQNAAPSDPVALGEYLRLHKETLIVAKAWRAHANASLVRLNAAAQFHGAGRDSPGARHNFGD